jgi:hypothetical protein
MTQKPIDLVIKTPCIPTKIPYVVFNCPPIIVDLITLRKSADACQLRRPLYISSPSRLHCHFLFLTPKHFESTLLYNDPQSAVRSQVYVRDAFLRKTHNSRVILVIGINVVWGCDLGAHKSTTTVAYFCF